MMDCDAGDDDIHGFRVSKKYMGNTLLNNYYICIWLCDRNWSPVGSIGTGGRFSKSPREREQMLAQRKTALLSQARRRFVSQSRGDAGDGEGEAFSEEGSSDSSHTSKVSV